MYGLYCECEKCLSDAPLIRYVGITIKPLDHRLKAHLTESSSGSTKAKDNWIRKHGSKNIRATVLESGITSIEDLRTAEIHRIEREGTYGSPYGLNMTRGGEGMWGYKHTDEARAKFRERTARQMDNKHPRAQIDESDVLSILARIWDGEATASIANDYPISAAAIQKIRSGENWPQVSRPSGTPKPVRRGNAGAKRVSDELKAAIWEDHTGKPGELKRLSKKYMVCETTVSLIVCGKRGLPPKWKTVGE